MLVLSRNKIFRRREFDFVNRFKGDFEGKLLKDFTYFDIRIKRQKGRIEARVRLKNRTFSLLKFVQGFISDKKIVT